MPTAIAFAPSFALVPYRDTEILAARVGDDVRIPMKKFCGTIGLPWEPQRKRIERNAVLREGASMMEVPSGGGVQAQMTLPLGLLSGFLVGVDANRCAPERRDAILAFQRESYQVLHEHFFGGRDIMPAPIAAIAPPPASWQELAAARRDAPALVDRITAERRPDVRRYLYQLLIADAERLGLAVPDLEDLGAAEPEPVIGECPVRGCTTRPLGAKRFCTRHWNRLPATLRAKLAFYLRPGLHAPRMISRAVAQGAAALEARH